MLKRTLRIAGYGFILGLILLSGLTLVPRSYDVLAFEERPNTLYWALSTGSKIGYQKWGFAEEYIETFPNTTLEIIVGAGHSIGMEHKEVYLSIISKFLDQ
ncbi:MAG: hypothetical protein KI786_04680 [Mameliella sp.]|nr:hypothetical protein [Phaeodactylibacter sp.]NRA47990.1 hypothetical protein [Phaeodactylibacter sp.]